ncbi:immunoglobulin domain-containing protein oig-4-like [Limulus polyphemus]|uniref:Immunoglobulin domain-containing protein oig-4-like n=1 Tax=Limulus polyphemus TaxID=6850 RepID=A0ABM1B3M1_LIMPO|nr:immunoglobulin domain-containing protein oig-4-like [Limulus polyphemus]
MKTRTIVTLALILCLLLVAESIRFRGWRRRGGRRRHPLTPKFMFYTHPGRKDYYDNPNGAKITRSSHFEYEFFLGHRIVFICVARGDPRPRITWYKDSIELYEHPYLQISEWHHGKAKLKSKLEITPARQMDSGTYECQANNKYAVDRKIFKADFSSYS